MRPCRPKWESESARSCWRRASWGIAGVRMNVHSHLIENNCPSRRSLPAQTTRDRIDPERFRTRTQANVGRSGKENVNAAEKRRWVCGRPGSALAPPWSEQSRCHRAAWPPRDPVRTGAPRPTLSGLEGDRRRKRGAVATAPEPEPPSPLLYPDSGVQAGGVRRERGASAFAAAGSFLLRSLTGFF